MKSRPEKSEALTAATDRASSEVTPVLTQGFNMSNFTQVSAIRAATVEFHGTPLTVITSEVGQRFVAMRPICDAIGLQWEAQLKRIKRSEILSEGMSIMDTPSAGGVQKTVCLLLDYLNGWLFGIEVNRAKPEIRERLKAYQRECYQALHAYWNEGLAVNPRAFSVHADQTLTAEQADDLRKMVETWAKKLSSDTKVQGKFIMQAWSKLKSHYKVSYRQIPQECLHEALSIVGRHAAQWEVVDEAPKAETLNDTVADWVRKIEEPNGYPAILFMPLVNAVLRKMGFTLPGSELPRLALTMTPPPSISYKYDRANPYPRNGRTIEVAKSIVADIRDWSDNLPAGPAKRDLYDATDTLYGLLVSGWTEVDEALGQLSTAMHYLNRWQGRGGRMGNIS